MTYPVATILRAREHHACGWSPGEIRRLLHRETGRAPTLKTIKRWTDPAYEERCRIQTAAAMRRRSAKRRRPRKVSHEMREETMRELLHRGLSPHAIGQVSAVWFGEELSAYAVTKRLGLREGEIRAARAAA